jgi:chemotaxis protein MotB
MSVREVEEEEGGGYFASISDLMVGILFVFLLVLTVFALNYREVEEVSRAQYEAAIEKARQAEERARLAEDAARRAEEKARGLRILLKEAAAHLRRDIEASTAARDRLLDILEKDLASQGIHVWIDRQAGILRLPGDTLFESYKAELKPGQREKIVALASALARSLPCFTPIQDRGVCDAADLPILETVLIEGHTDRAQILTSRGPFRDNDQLSSERALSVFRSMREAEPRLNSLSNADDSYPLLGFSGFGERRPLPNARGDTPQDYAQNRRIDLRFLLARTGELERLHAQIEKALRDSEQ